MNESGSLLFSDLLWKLGEARWHQDNARHVQKQLFVKEVARSLSELGYLSGTLTIFHRVSLNNQEKWFREKPALVHGIHGISLPWVVGSADPATLFKVFFSGGVSKVDINDDKNIVDELFYKRILPKHILESHIDALVPADEKSEIKDNIIATVRRWLDDCFSEKECDGLADDSIYARLFANCVEECISLIGDFTLKKGEIKRVDIDNLVGFFSGEQLIQRHTKANVSDMFKGAMRLLGEQYKTSLYGKVCEVILPSSDNSDVKPSEIENEIILAYLYTFAPIVLLEGKVPSVVWKNLPHADNIISLIGAYYFEVEKEREDEEISREVGCSYQEKQLMMLLETINRIHIDEALIRVPAEEEARQDLYCAQIVNRFSADSYLKLIGERQSEAYSRDRHHVIRNALREINQICAEEAKAAGLARVIFTVPENGENTLWSCYQRVTEWLTSHRGTHKWTETEAHNYLLMDIGFIVEKSPDQNHREVLDHKLEQNLIKTFGIYITQDLWSQVQAMEQSLQIGRMSERHTVHHEVGRLLSVLSIHLKQGIQTDADSDLARWAISILRERILAIGSHGESGIEAKDSDACDLWAFMTHVQRLERPQSVDFNGWPSQVKIVFEPGTASWRAKISDANFYAIWNNLWRNAHDALTVYSWAGGNPGPKLGPRVNQIEREYGVFVDRFEDELPKPTLLVLIRQLAGEIAIAVEVLDNAPELLGQPVTYVSRRTEDGHMGNHILRDVEQAVRQVGVSARYEPAAALKPIDCQTVNEVLVNASIEGFNCLNAAQWTRAAFIIERLV